MRLRTRMLSAILVLLALLTPLMSRPVSAADYYGTVGEPFYQVIDTSESMLECKLSSGAFPPGLSCGTNGSAAYIKGTPTGAGTYGAGIYLEMMEGGRTLLPSA